MRHKVVALIPARAGSKGVPKKNIKLIGGFPLIAYSIIASKLSQNINEVIVSTDSKEIAKIAKKFNANVPFIRPRNISKDKSTDIEYIKHAIDWYQKKRGYKPQYWVIIRPTTPLRNPKLIDKSINYFQKKSSASSLVSVHEMSETPAKMFGMQNGYLHGLSPFDPRPEYYTLPRQQFPSAYVGNGYVDIVKTSIIEKYNSLYGSQILGFKTPDVGEIDIVNDINKVEFFLINKKNTLHQYLLKNYNWLLNEKF